MMQGTTRTRAGRMRKPNRRGKQARAAIRYAGYAACGMASAAGYWLAVTQKGGTL